MSIGSIQFHPSVIEDKIYDILDSNPDFIISSREYTHEAIEEVINFMSELYENSNLQYSIIDDAHPDEEGGSVSICWIENGYLHHLVISYRHRWETETLEDEEEFWKMVHEICDEEGSV